MNKTIKLGLSLALAFFLSACAMVGPDYHPPTAKAPAAWHAGLAGGLHPGPANPRTLARWWTVFHDPLLMELENKALRGSLDLKTARSRVREARALMGVSRAGLFPEVNSSLSAIKSRSSRGGESNLYNAGFDAGWELDIFGGRRRAVEAATADLNARRDALRDVMVSLTAEVGINYIDLRTYQARLKAARANLATQKESYQLNKSRYQAGLIDELALEQSRANMELTRSRIPDLETGIIRVMNRLAVLLGQRPGSLDAKLAAPAPVPSAPAAIMVGVPAETLRRRPDIHQAEQELAAQTARIGVAKAALYPKFQLNGSIGLESLRLENLPEWASRTFQLGPTISWNIFDAGAIRRRIAVENARQEQALIHYQATVLSAVEEVENTLTAYVKAETSNHSLTQAVKAAARAEQAARDRYQAGLTDFSNVLDTQRTLLSLDDKLAQSTGAVTSDLIRLYKALGGGWTAVSTKQKAAVK
ncbi:MAG TPA: efflux transporter outer membrane subunit [Desulfobacterales bacterium]|nr:efflux transporter outer membrane subunit [Desulfobacterales bacterium]